MEKRNLTPREIVAKHVMEDESRERTMTDEEASEALRGLLIHLRDRAISDIDSPEGLDAARQYEICARTVACFGAALIASGSADEEIWIPEGKEEN